MTNQAVLCLTANEQLVHVGSEAWVPACAGMTKLPLMRGDATSGLIEGKSPLPAGECSQ